MATIMEDALWTLTEAAAERMVENGLLTKCEGKHTAEVLEVDRPIYHVACDAPNWFGFSTMDQAIRSAEAHVSLEAEIKEIEKELKVPESRIGSFRFMEMTLDPTLNPEPGGVGSITVVKETPDAGES